MIKLRRPAVLLLLGLGILFIASLYWPFPRARLGSGLAVSLEILDRAGRPLRELLSDEGGRCRWVKIEDISPFLLKATIASEDRNYFLHPGLNIPSMGRAFVQNLKRRRVVSGASTITQQVVRLIFRWKRDLPHKLLEAWLALRLERTLSKEEILIQYLNRAFYGNQAYGAEAAARLYFGKPASELGLAESAFLAAIPRAPSTTNPYRDPGASGLLTRDVLARMLRAGFISPQELRQASLEVPRVIPARESFHAPHFCEFALNSLSLPERKSAGRLMTTLDLELQEKIETLLRTHLASQENKGVGNGAAVVLDNRSGEILAMVGSRDFFDDQNGGQVNGALALRQPGSALKPFAYAMALERGMTPATVLADEPIEYPAPGGSYRPRNYDRKFHGSVRMRSALACSYNVPAVSILEDVGPDFLLRRLKSLGLDSLDRPASFYGMGLALGNGEVSLLDLTRAYASLAGGGVFSGFRSIRRIYDTSGKQMNIAPTPPPVRVFNPQVSYIITDILADPDARIPSFGYGSPLTLPFPCAAKTGTSKDSRDNWALGYTTLYTVGVWVGNFDGRPMHDVSGITGCGPLFRDIMLLLHQKQLPEAFPMPSGLVRKAICPLSGELEGPTCPGRMDELFIAGTEPRTLCRLAHGGDNLPSSSPLPFSARPAPGFWIVSPRNGDVFKIDPVLRREYQSLRLRVDLGGLVRARLIEWRLDGKILGTAEAGGEPLIWNLQPGSYTIKAVAVTDGRRVESRPVRITVLS